MPQTLQRRRFLQSPFVTAKTSMLLLTAGLLLLAQACLAAAAQPNIVQVLADDLGAAR